MTPKKKVTVLGVSGSIGQSSLDILRNKCNRLHPVLFSAHNNSEILVQLKKEFPGVKTVLTAHEGKEGLLNAINTANADITVNGIAGAAGLEPSIAAIKSGSDLALANKETIVMAGPLVYALAGEKNVKIIPVDSEHSAIFKLIEAHGKDNVHEIILTASGGPFRNFSAEDLKKVTPEEALAHPTWNMGPKITIDSASLANKGLEVIEAAFLFGLPPEKIRVTVHPQSLVHSMVRLKNGAIYAQMSKPDMRLPIHDALFWPETEISHFDSAIQPDFDSLQMTFEKCDHEKFPMLNLAYKALAGSPFLPAVYNAANEVAVQAFLEGKISFLEISSLVGYVINRSRAQTETPFTIEAVLEQDAAARKLAQKYIVAKVTTE